MISPDKVSQRKVLPASDSLKADSESAKDIKPATTPNGGKPSLIRRNSLMRQTNAFKYMYALEQMKVQSEEDVDTLEDIRITIKKYMSNSAVGVLYENLIILISIASAVVYIHSTYALDRHNSYQNQRKVIDVIDLVFVSIFAFDWALNLFLADSKVYYFWSFFSWVDILIIISMLSTRTEELPQLNPVNTFYIGMLYSFFVFRPVRILRSLRCYTKFSGIIDPVDRYASQMGIFTAVFILFFSAVMQILERHAQVLPFHTWMYYCSVTVSTVGYGDITPKTAAGRVLAMSIIGCAVISVPVATNELIEKMKLQSVYMRSVYTAKSRNAKHIIICGDLSSTSLVDFFGELFHDDHENDGLNAVILLPKPPTVELILLMQSAEYFLSLTYLEGSALNDHDLRRAKAETASAIFVMTNKFSSNPDEEDAKSILLNLSIKRYLQAFYRPRILYCVQLLKPENRRHLTKSETNEIDDSDIVVCLNEVKMGAMAQALLYPGANILLMNLLTSFSDEGIDVDESRLTVEDIPTSDSAEETVRNSPKAWFDEYSRGCDWEIYITKLSRVFDNAKFSELSYALYEKKGVLLFALQLKDKKVAGASRLVLNPGSFVIPSQDEYDIQAFVIAKNTASSDLSFTEETPVHTEHTALQLMSRNFGSVAYIMKSAADNVMERRKSSLKDVNKLRTAVVVNKLEAVGEDEEEETSKSMKKESRWKALKRSALLERRIKSDSFQEVVHRYEDEHFAANYYVRKTPIKLEDVTIRKDVITEVPTINHHIIIIARSLRNVFDLLRPLRSKHLGPMKYIVILHPFEIPLDVWRRISVLDGLLFVRGSSLEDANLKRAGIFRASTVIVVADGAYEQEGGDKTNSSENLVDSDAIFTYQHVKRLNPQCHVIVEIVNQSNIGYLEDHSNPSLVDDPKFSPQFAAGALFATGLLDSIVCQAYYNPEIVKVINKMIAGVDQIERSQLMLRAAEELGHVDKSNSSDESSSSSESENEKGDDEDEQSNSGRNRSRSWSGSGKEDPRKRKNSETSTGANKVKRKKREDLPQELLLHKSRRKLLKIPNSCLYQISIPENLEKKTYGALFQLLAAQGVIPLGIYRGVLSMGIGPKANRMPYVFTNPPQDTELYACDLIFVLSTKTERANNSKLEIKDWLLNLQMQKSKGDESGGTPTNKNPRATRSTQIITGAKRETILPGGENKEAETYDVSYKKLEEKFKNFTTHLDQKLVSIIESMEKVLEDSNNGVPSPSQLATALTSARSYTFDEGTMVSGTTNGNSLEVENSNSGRYSMSSHVLGSGSEEKKEDDQSSGRFMFTNGDNGGISTTNPFNPLLFPRKSSLKKRMSNPTVPAISEEPHSSGQSTAHSEDDDGENRSSEQRRNSATDKETAHAFASRFSGDAHGIASESPGKSHLGRGSRQTMTIPNQPKSSAVIEAKAAVENKLLAGFATRAGRQTVIANKSVKPTEFVEKEVSTNNKLEKAISNISMDFSITENESIREHENEDDAEEIVDTSPLEPIKYQTANGRESKHSSLNEERKRLDSEDVEMQRNGTLLNEDRARESSGKSYEGRSNRSSIISLTADSLPGPKLTSVSPLPLDRLAKVKSLTDFKDTKSGKIRSTIIRPNHETPVSVNPETNSKTN